MNSGFLSFLENRWKLKFWTKSSPKSKSPGPIFRPDWCTYDCRRNRFPVGPDRPGFDFVGEYFHQSELWVNSMEFEPNSYWVFDAIWIQLFHWSNNERFWLAEWFKTVLRVFSSSLLLVLRWLISTENSSNLTLLRNQLRNYLLHHKLWRHQFKWFAVPAIVSVDSFKLPLVNSR